MPFIIYHFVSEIKVEINQTFALKYYRHKHVKITFWNFQILCPPNRCRVPQSLFLYIALYLKEYIYMHIHKFLL